MNTHLNKSKTINIKEHESFKTEKEYRVSPRLSYSVSKDMDFNPRVLVSAKKERKTDFFSLGKAVDILVTDKDNFDTQYYISNSKIPSISEIIETIYENKLSFNRKKDIPQIIAIGRDFNYQPRWLDDTLYKYFKTTGSPYLALLKDAQGKAIIDDDNYLLALTMANSIKEKHYDLVDINTDVEELIFQFKYAFEYQDVDFKIMIDIIKINHLTRTVTPIDIKTGSVPVTQFFDSFMKFKYYYQGGLYTVGLQKLINKLNAKSNVVYTVENFKFIYVNKFTPNFPLVYNFTTSWYNRAHNGWKDLVKGRKIKGLRELAKDYLWYRNNDSYEVSREVQEHYDVEIDLQDPPLTQFMANAYLNDLL